MLNNLSKNILKISKLFFKNLYNVVVVKGDDKRKFRVTKKLLPYSKKSLKAASGNCFKRLVVRRAK